MTKHVFYKHYNVEGGLHPIKGTGRPPWFDYENCFRNLLATIEGRSDIKLYLLMDGNIDTNFVSKYKSHYISHEYSAELPPGATANGHPPRQRGSVIESINYAKKIAEQSPPSDLIYIMENDYLHVPGWPDKLNEIFNLYEQLSYVSLYDHADKYPLTCTEPRYPWSPDYTSLVSQIITTPSHHWRTTPSTCGTYVVNAQVFLEDAEVPLSMEGDHGKFLHLAKTRGRSVITPIPGLCTHCWDNVLSPCIDWEKLNSLYSND